MVKATTMAKLSEGAERQGGRKSDPLTRAFVSMALIPVFVGVAAVVTIYVDALTPAADPSAGPSPFWVQNMQSLLWIAILLIPGIAAVINGGRALRSGKRWGLLPVLVGTLLCVCVTFFALLQLSIVGGALLAVALFALLQPLNRPSY